MFVWVRKGKKIEKKTDRHDTRTETESDVFLLFIEKIRLKYRLYKYNSHKNIINSTITEV